MTQNLTKFLSDSENKKYAIQNGTKIHALLKNVIIDDACGDSGDEDIINKIKEFPGLVKYFCANAKTETPIAGFINNVFLSRRIDRMLIDQIQDIACFVLLVNGAFE